MKAMKALLMLGAMLALTACSNEDDTITAEPTTGTDTTAQTIKFNLTASHPDDGGAQTRAVKTGWESGDAIFVFFTGAAAPKHLKMTYDGTNWSSAEYDGATQTAGALGLTNGMSGTMRAVFLPFGRNATVVADGTAFKFDYYNDTYYATATLSYTVTDNTVSGAFNMTIPDGWVQFFVEDEYALKGRFHLATDAVKPTAIASITAYGTITEQQGSAGADMTGYAYSGGYLFSGKLNAEYYSIRYVSGTLISDDAYYFAKTNTQDNTRADYFVTGKTLASHDAVKLPANSSVYTNTTASTGKWVTVGSGITVALYNVRDAGTLWESVSSLGTWQTCNHGQSAPEALGSLYTFDAANALGITLPTKTQCETLANSTTSAFMHVHGQLCMAAKADKGIILLPCYASGGAIWTSTADDSNSNHGWKYNFSSHGRNGTQSVSKSDEHPVRALGN